MKKIFVLLLAAMLLMAGCEKETEKKSKRWDREAKALECIEGFNNSSSVEQMEEYVADMYPETRQELETLLEQGGTVAQVAWVKFVETYEGVDVFSVAFYADAVTGTLLSHVGAQGLVRQGNHYMLCGDVSLQEEIAARYTDCLCHAGKVYEQSDPCATCSGTGFVEESESADSHSDQPDASGEESATVYISPSYDPNGEYAYVMPLNPDGSQDTIEWSTVVTIDPNVFQESPTIETFIIDGELSGEIQAISPELYQVVPDSGLVIGGNCPDCNGQGCARTEAKDCTACGGLGLLITE